MRRKFGRATQTVSILALMVALVACGDESGDDESGETSAPEEALGEESSEEAAEESDAPEQAEDQAQAEGAGDAPFDLNETLEITVAFGPGGGSDMLMRTLAGILEDHGIYPGPIQVTNREGAGGAIGYDYVHQQAGSPYHLTGVGTGIVTNPLSAETTWETGDFTPIGRLASEGYVVAVLPESPIESFDDFLDAGQSGSLTIAGTNVVSASYMAVALLREEIEGFDFDWVAFDGQGEANTALLSDSVDALVGNPGEIAGLIESGEVEPIIFSGESAPSFISDVETYADAGLQAEMYNPRGVVAPPEMDPAAQEWWVDAFQRIVETPEWQEYLETDDLLPNYLWGSDYGDFLNESSETWGRVLREAGAIE